VSRLEAREAAGLALAVAVIAVVGTLVLTVGVIPFPSTPPLAEQPDPAVPGRLAYVRYERGEACLHVVDGRGGDTMLGCGDRYDAGQLGWTGDGYVALTAWGNDVREAQIIDPVTGATVEVREVAENAGPRIEPGDDRHRGPAVASDGREVSTRSDRGHVTVSVGKAGTSSVIWEATGPTSYRIDEVRWSPDEAWLLLRDSRGSLLVLRADGVGGPRRWVEDGGWRYAWFIRDR